MRSNTRPAVGPISTAVTLTRPVGPAAILRLKSWLLVRADHARPVVVGGEALPERIGTTTTRPQHALCIGPGEWLVISSERGASSLHEQMESELSAQSIAVVDLTDGMSTLEVQGPATRELLAKGCGLDLHPQTFPAGRCARTRFAQIPVIVECLDESARFGLYVARSYHNYLYAWLNDAAVEFEARATE
jgi:sarcosine oxidase, subunit gamma